MKLRGRSLLLAAGLSALAVGADWAPTDFVAAADQGRCIEDVVYQQISTTHGVGAAELVQAAVAALDARGEQQRQLGCDGDIAAQAIAAGADPAIVLETMAASL
jgi:hypothetical protein